MSGFEQKISAVVLNRIRGRANTGDAPTQATPSGSQKVTIRDAELCDFEGVSELSRSLQQGADSFENWERLWRDNPAIREEGASSRIGWLLEAEQKTVGFLGTIPLIYLYGGKKLIAAATCRFAVHPAFRSSSHLLMMAFMRQKNVDLFLNTTATPSAGKIMMALAASQIPQKDYGKVLFWVLDSGKFTKHLLSKLGLIAPVGRIAGGIGSIALTAEAVLRGRRPGSPAKAYVVAEHDIEDIPAAFDRFCHQALYRTDRLMARRDCSIMRWHFCPPLNSRKSRAILCYSGDQIVGYVVIRHEMSSKGNLKRALISDLISLHDETDVVESLIAAAYGNAQKQGSHVLEFMGFPGFVRDVVESSRPYSREYPACPFFFKARDKELHKALLDEKSWYASPFDGDATLWP